MQHNDATSAEVMASSLPQSAARTMAVTAGPELESILRGETDILEVVFPGGSMDMALAVYAEDEVSYMCNEVVVEAVTGIHAQIVRLHIFEIGSGTGGTTSSVLPVMNNWSTKLIFTDLSDVFLIKARA
jgi:hypothetical protein